uniref:Uncharacterized protein n=1 Tax=Vespula pensylvanica TaxID=30213 RepID=A0A834P982_VESPE|nr:hypothetical protein H0235_002078 [Vespula pensylvanica]
MLLVLSLVGKHDAQGIDCHPFSIIEDNYANDISSFPFSPLDDSSRDAAADWSGDARDERFRFFLTQMLNPYLAYAP